MKKRMSLKPRRSGDPDLLIDINTTPLIDVMLVLLVMLIITIPIQLHAVHLQLPGGAPPRSTARPAKVQIGIDARSIVAWDGVPVSAEELDRRMMIVAAQAVPPEVHLKPHPDSQYAVFANVLASSRRSGLASVTVVGTEQFGP